MPAFWDSNSTKENNYFFPASLDPARPRDPINNVCSFTGKSISNNYFTYRSVQIFEILLEAFYSPESDTRHKIMQDWFDYSTQLAL